VSLAARGSRYARFLGWAALAVAALLVMGYLPTRRWGGDRAALAMAVGCALGWASAALGGLPLRSERKSPQERLNGMMLGMAARVGAAAVLAVATLAAFDLDRRALLLWLALSYCALLALEVKFALAAD
jgi:hypothetical protein